MAACRSVQSLCALQPADLHMLQSRHCAGAPLALILKYKCDGINPESPEASADCKEYVKWGDDILVSWPCLCLCCLSTEL